MATVCTYLNFADETEAAFEFYRSVFKTEYLGPIARLGDVPRGEGQNPLSEAEKKLIMNVTLPITGGHLLMGTDAPESMGFKLVDRIDRCSARCRHLIPKNCRMEPRGFYELG